MGDWEADDLPSYCFINQNSYKGDTVTNPGAVGSGQGEESREYDINSRDRDQDSDNKTSDDASKAPEEQDS